MQNLRSILPLNDPETPVQFHVTLSEPRDGTVRALLSGDLDYLSVPELSEALQSSLASSELKEVILDLSGITYLSGAGLGAMVALRHALREKRAELFLTGCHGQVLRILQVTRLVFFFQMLAE